MTQGGQQLSDVQRAALKYLERGWRVVPLEGKIPIIKAWQKRVITADEAPQLFSGDRNVAILLGEPSGHLVDIDLDCPEAVRAAPLLLPETPMRHGRKQTGLSHWWYACQLKGTTRYHDVDDGAGKVCLVELRSTGAATMAPPSTHPDTGETVAWAAGATLDPARVSARDLAAAARKLAAVALLARHWYSGQRNELAMLAGGWLAHARVPREQAETLIAAICKAALDDEPQNRQDAVRRSYDRHEAGEEVAGARKLAELVGEAVVRQAGRWLGHKGRTGHTPAGGDRGKLRCGVNPYRWELMADLNCHDSGNANRLLERHGDELLHCAAWHGAGTGMGGWLVYHEDEGRWRTDKLLRARLMAMNAARRIADEAEHCTNADERATLSHWAVQSRTTGRIQAMLEQAAASPPVAIEPGYLDRHPTMLNVANCTLDLSRERLAADPQLPHDRTLRLTRLAPVHYDPDAACDRWLSFLDEIFDGHADLIAFIQRLAGYCLLSGNPEQVFLVLWGEGANGKSALLSALRMVLGDYAASVDPNVLMSRETGSNYQLYALAALRGARLVTSIETKRDKQLDESLVKAMTGGDPIMCREPYGAPFEFRPEFTPFLATNNRPEVHDTSEGMWRRLLLVPFTVQIPEEQRDQHLEDKFAAETSGILNWMLDGLKEYYSLEDEYGRGLKPPPQVRAATDEYRSEQDLLRPFFDDMVKDGYRVSKRALADAYNTWCEANGVDPVKPRTFSRLVKARVKAESKSGNTRYWEGICLEHPPIESQLPGGAEGGTQ